MDYSYIPIFCSEEELLKNHCQLEILKYQAMMKFSVMVIYNPDCGCSIDQFVLLDRYPMSEKIHHHCDACGKFMLTSISNPIRFHTQFDNKDFTLDDLKSMVINPLCTQSKYLLLYKKQIEENRDH